MKKKIILAASAAVLMAGCTTTPRDTSQLRSEISEAQAGDFGKCLENLSNAAVQLGEAKRVLAKAETSRVSDAQYERGLQAASQGANYRRAAEDVCLRRTARMEREVEAVGGRVAELERVREIIRGVTFERDSAVLTQSAKTVLNVVANRLIRAPVKVEVAGFTSSTGKAEHNLELSQRRAEAVRDYLIRRGVNPDNLTAKGFGMADPIASNETQEGRNANKRVELHFYVEKK